MNFVETLPVHMIRHGHADDLAQHLLKVWERTRGERTFPMEIAPLCQHFLVMAGEADQGDSPDILHVGDRTLLGKIMPGTTASDEEQPRELMPTAFRNLVHKGYHKAISGEPNYDMIATDYAPNSQPMRITYERLILPWQLKTGVIQLVCYVIPREIRQLGDPTNHVPTKPYSPPLQDPGQWSRAVSPI